MARGGDPRGAVIPSSFVDMSGVAAEYESRVRGIAVFRTVYFVPSVIVASVVGSVLWLQLLNPDYGLINPMLRPAGILVTTPGWVVPAGWRCTQYLLRFDRTQVLRGWTARRC